MATLQERQEVLRTNLEKLEDEVQRAACPIYGIKTSEGVLVGSGFLLHIAEDLLLVTAAHVLEWRRTHALHLPGDKVLVPLGGQVLTTTTYDKDGKPDFGYDIGCVVLKTPTTVPGCTVLSPASLDVDDLPARQTMYGFTGFPETQNRAKPGRKFQQSSVIYGAIPGKSELYKSLGFHPITHFIVEFEREKVISRERKIITGPKPNGISGGPVWRLGHFAQIERGAAIPRVIGIGIEWHQKEKCLVGVRMSLVIGAIAGSFSKYQTLLPSAARLRVNATVRE